MDCVSGGCGLVWDAHRQERFGDQAFQIVKFSPGYLAGGVECEAAPKDGKAWEDGTFIIRQQQPRLLEDGPQAAVAFWYVPLACGEHVQAAFDFGNYLSTGDGR